MVDIRPGSRSDIAIVALNDAARTAGNVLGAGGTGLDMYNAYLKWATDHERVLNGCLTEAALERLLLTRRYWTIQNMDPSRYGPTLSSFITLELNACIEALTAAAKELAIEESLWLVPPQMGAFADHLTAVVIDTNVMMHARGAGLLEYDWAAIADTRDRESIAIAIPEVVVAELDKHKHSNQKMTIGGVDHQRRWLATLSLGWLSTTFPDNERRTLLRSATMTKNGRTPNLYAVLQTNPLEHLPLADPDSEIISTAIGLEGLAKAVTLATYDNAMAFRARRYVRVHRMPEPEAGLSESSSS